MLHPRQQSHVRRWPTLLLAGLLLAGLVDPAQAQDPGIYLYQGADREQRLIERAKQDGIVSAGVPWVGHDEHAGPLMQRAEDPRLFSLRSHRQLPYSTLHDGGPSASQRHRRPACRQRED